MNEEIRALPEDGRQPTMKEIALALGLPWGTRSEKGKSGAALVTAIEAMGDELVIDKGIRTGNAKTQTPTTYMLARLSIALLPGTRR